MPKQILWIVLLLQILKPPHIRAKDLISRDVFAGVVAVLRHASVMGSVGSSLRSLLEQRAREGAHCGVESGIEPVEGALVEYMQDRCI